MTVYMKKGDRLPLLRAQLTGADGVAIDLTASTVTFRMKPRNGGALKVNTTANVVDAVNGIVQYGWAAGDTDTEGIFDGEFVTSTGGLLETMPSSGYVVISVEPVLS